MHDDDHFAHALDLIHAAETILKRHPYETAVLGEKPAAMGSLLALHEAGSEVRRVIEAALGEPLEEPGGAEADPAVLSYGRQLEGMVTAGLVRESDLPIKGRQALNTWRCREIGARTGGGA